MSLVDFAVQPSAATVPNGTVTFQIVNRGDIEHDFIVIRTDLAPDQLPRDASGKSVDLSKLQVLSQSVGIAAGESRSIAVAMSAGRYVLICNEQLHYKNGMRVGFTVQ